MIASVVVISCQKDHATTDNNVEQNRQTFKDLQLEKRILAFRDQIDLIRDNPNLKSGNEPMSLDSAVWYIEAASNLTYGDAAFEREELVFDSSFIEVPVTGGEILMADIQMAYDQVVDSLSAHNTAISASQKQLIVADIALKETDEDHAVLALTSGFGIIETDGVGLGNTYPWYWGWELGRCDGSGLGVGKDAADIIAQLANANISLPGGSAYYTDVSFEWVNYWDVPAENNPYGDYLLFHDFQQWTLNHKCMSPEEIAYYANALQTIGNMYQPINKDIIWYFLWDDTAYGLCEPYDCWDMAHFAKIKYGIWHTSNNPPADL